MPPKKVLAIRNQIVPVLALSYCVTAPFMTFLLLWLKGLPPFAEHHAVQVIAWVYEMTWIPSFLASFLLAFSVFRVIQRTTYFHAPYDFGRSFSLGAIIGALAQALATWVYRLVTHHPFSDFWIAGALIAGCLTGAFLTAFFLRKATSSTPA